MQLSSEFARLNCETILVLEDEPLIASDLVISLEDAGAKAVVICNIADALWTAKQPAISAALLDLRIGDKLCLEVCELLADRGVPFVIYSGDCSAFNSDKWPNAQCISKPASWGEISAALAKACNRDAVENRTPSALSGGSEQPNAMMSPET